MNDDDVHTEGSSSVAPIPRGPLSSTSLASVPASDRQTTLSVTQTSGSMVESASVVVVNAAGAQPSTEFTCGDTSSTKVMEQQTKSEELTVRTQEKFDTHEQVTSS